MTEDNQHCFLCEYSIPHFFKDGKVIMKNTQGGTEVHCISLNYCPECGKQLKNYVNDEKEKNE